MSWFNESFSWGVLVGFAAGFAWDWHSRWRLRRRVEKFEARHGE